MSATDCRLPSPYGGVQAAAKGRLIPNAFRLPTHALNCSSPLSSTEGGRGKYGSPASVRSDHPDAISRSIGPTFRPPSLRPAVLGTIWAWLPYLVDTNASYLVRRGGLGLTRIISKRGTETRVLSTKSPSLSKVSGRHKETLHRKRTTKYRVAESA